MTRTARIENSMLRLWKTPQIRSIVYARSRPGRRAEAASATPPFASRVQAGFAPERQAVYLAAAWPAIGSPECGSTDAGANGAGAVSFNATFNGSRTLNREPSPSRLSTATSP